MKHFTNRAELYAYLDAQEHHYDELTDADRLMDVQHTGAALADAGWTIDDEPDGLLDMLAEPDGDDYLTSEQARVILTDIERYTAKEND